MIELYVIACLSGFCHDHSLGFMPKEEMTPYKCTNEAVKRYMTQKFPAYPEYAIKRYGCRKPTSKGA